MTTTITPEQADTLPVEAIDLDPKALEAAANAYWAQSHIGFVCPPWSSAPPEAKELARANVRAAITAYLARRTDDHYFAVDYTGCIHEAPDRETAIQWAEDFARTANGGAIGSERPEVAAAIGSLARRAAAPSEQEPVAWRFELARARNTETGEYVNFGPPELDFTKPHVPKGSIRNLQPLYTHPAPAAGVKVKPPKWDHEVAIGADTPEEWFATTPEGQSLTVTYDESCKLPWVARPFPPGPSNYATADEAKAALEAAREARIRRALDTGEPK